MFRRQKKRLYRYCREGYYKEMPFAEDTDPSILDYIQKGVSKWMNGV